MTPAVRVSAGFFTGTKGLVVGQPTIYMQDSRRSTVADDRYLERLKSGTSQHASFVGVVARMQQSNVRNGS